MLNIEEIENQGLNRSYLLSIAIDDIEQAARKEMMERQLTLQIKGFRRGRVPFSIIQRMMGNEIRDRILRTSIETEVDEYLQRNNIRPFRTPELEENLENGNDSNLLKFNLSVELSPSIDDIDINNLGISKAVVEITDGMIDEGIASFVRSRTVYKDKPTDTVIEEGDRVTLSARGFIDGEEITNSHIENHDVIIGSNQLIQDLEQGLKGYKTGDTPDVEVNFPQDYHFDMLAGKHAVFSCSISKVQTADNSPSEEEILKTANIDTMEEMRSSMAERIKNFYDNRSVALLKETMVRAIGKNLKFDVPKSAFDREYQLLLNEYESSNLDTDAEEDDVSQEEVSTSADESDGETVSVSTEKSTSLDDEHISENTNDIVPAEDTSDINHSIAESAMERVRINLYLSKVGVENGIKLSNEEFSDSVTQRSAELYPGEEKEYMQWLNSDESHIRGLYAQILQEKTIDFLAQSLNCEDRKVTVRELEEEIRVME